MVNSYYTYSCIFLSLYKTYLVLTYHTGNYHPRQRNRMQGSKSPSPKANSMLFCILSTVVMNIYFLLINHLNFVSCFQYFSFYQPFFFTLFPWYLWDNSKKLVLAPIGIARARCLHTVNFTFLPLAVYQFSWHKQYRLKTEQKTKNIKSM